MRNKVIQLILVVLHCTLMLYSTSQFQQFATISINNFIDICD